MTFALLALLTIAASPSPGIPGTGARKAAPKATATQIPGPKKIVDGSDSQSSEKKGLTEAEWRKKPKRSVWNLTFLPGNPPDVTASGGVNFATDSPNLAATALATALNAAYGGKADATPVDVGADSPNTSATDKSAPNKSAPKAAPATPPVPAGARLSVTAVGNTLVLEGETEVVDEVRRLLATQIDIAQSQVVLELSAYQISANSKGRDSANASLRRLLLAQEIARAYKHAYLEAVQFYIVENDRQIQDAMAARSRERGFDIPGLFRRAGFDPSAQRSFGTSEMLLFLAYADGDDLDRRYGTLLRQAFQATHDAVEERILDPLKLDGGSAPSSRDATLYSDLKELNDRIARRNPGRDGKWPEHWSALDTYAATGEAGRLEDIATRTTIENFFLLWLSTARPASYVRKAAEKRTLGAAPQQPVGAAFERWGVAWNPDPAHERAALLAPYVTGDTTGALARVSIGVDTLFEAGVGALRRDSEQLVDAPLESWLDRKVLTHGGDSRFGTRFGGTTTLAVTSRVPGVTGAEADSFFPSQPVAPISLSDLTGLLARKPSKLPAPDATSPGGNLALGGLTPLEILALQGAFAQAEKPPYYRKLTSGLHFSVLPTMLPSGGTVRLQVKLALSVDPGEENKAGVGSRDIPAPIDVLKSTVVETELLVNAFDIAQVSSLKLDVGAPGKRDWAVPILSQILPVRSWFVGPTQDRTVRHEAVILVKATIVPRAMDLASRFLDTATSIPEDETSSSGPPAAASESAPQPGALPGQPIKPTPPRKLGRNSKPARLAARSKPRRKPRLTLRTNRA